MTPETTCPLAPDPVSNVSIPKREPSQGVFLFAYQKNTVGVETCPVCDDKDPGSLASTAGATAGRNLWFRVWVLWLFSCIYSFIF